MPADWLHGGKRKDGPGIPGLLRVWHCKYPGSRSVAFFLHQGCYKILVG